MNWKEITRKLSDLHSENESAVVRLNPHSKGVLVNLSNEELHLELEGKELKLKKLRRFLWENRNERALTRKSSTLWSAYIEEENKSLVGVGAYTSPQVAERLEKYRNGI